MFKVIALIGAVAGGATYGIYEYAYQGGECPTCPLSRKASCCADAPSAVSAEPACCANGEACCEFVAPCCAAKTDLIAAKKSCCSEGTETGAMTTFFTSAVVAKKGPSCCATPCAACADGCDGCPICEIDCAECCGLAAKVAVGGPAAVVNVVKARK